MSNPTAHYHDMIKHIDDAKKLHTYKQNKAQNSIFHFIKATFRHYKYENWHHKVISDFYNSLIERKITRGIICIPPRHMKTEGLERAEAWALGRNSDEKIIHCSAAMPRARKTSVNVKRIIKDNLFNNVFPDFLNSGVSNTKTLGNKAKDIKEDQNTFWELGSGTRGSYLAAGVRGSITGEGFTIGSLDDPTGSAQDAESPTIQEMEEEWFTGTFLDRQDEEDSVIIIIMQRWGVHDMVGRRLLKDGMQSYNGHKPQPGVPEWNGQPEGEWNVLCLPRIMDEESFPWKHRDDPRELGEVLWPQRYSKAMTLRQKKTMPKHIWESKQQQRPKVRGGNLVDGRLFIPIEPNQVPVGGKWVRFADLAATKKRADIKGKINNPDFTASGLVQYVDGNYYIWHVAACQESPAKRDKMILRDAKRDSFDFGGNVLQTWEEESGASGKDVTEKYNHLLRNFLRQPTRIGKSKEFYVRNFSNKVETGNVYIVNYRDWIQEKHDGNTFKDEAEMFPSTLCHDDRIDAVAKACHVASGGAIEELESPERIQKPKQSKTVLEQVREAVLNNTELPQIENISQILEAIADDYVNLGDADKADLFLDEAEKYENN